MATTALERLSTRLDDLFYLTSAAAALSWEQQTYMPTGGAQTRAGQLATLARLEHEMFTAHETGALLQAAAQEVADADYGSPAASLVRVTQRDYDLRTKIPAALVAELTHHQALAQGAWVQARAQNDYGHFEPALAKMIELTRQVAEHLGYTDHIYDALLNNYEPGMKTAAVAAMFDALKLDLVPLVAAIKANAGRVNDDMLHRDYPLDRQEAFTERIAAAYGFDFAHGRQDQSAHPFCQAFSPEDVRITTRFDPKFLNSALFGTMHETGHALYEQGSAGPGLHMRLRSGTSLGVHESQSRLWENIVGRSRGFWKHWYPELQKTFPESLGDVELEAFYRAINKSGPSFIRVEADEVTYNLHIIIRFEMETELLTGQLTVKDAPEAWNAKYQSYLGITPPTNSVGILQDIHWSIGLIGYFPTYSIGNLLSAQFYEKALAAHPAIPAEIEAGKYDTLLGWLRTNIHQYGRTYQPQELVQKVTGERLNSRAYIAYLRAKYGEIYGF
jgi:carboxypeptidase Taq